ncbi:MAG TPA: hypothetical protein P5572_07700 [Phycisphaerae bacterium]|nr:hypothetical protein [Phycisphaerales bacterium]HRX84885.1 hypothetical protein [Phycisphaerae bacterium]
MNRLDAVTGPLSAGELAHWRERVAAIPDVRMHRVLRVRRAIHDRGYEATRIDRVVEALGADLDLLCAQDPFFDSFYDE